MTFKPPQGRHFELPAETTVHGYVVVDEQRNDSAIRADERNLQICAVRVRDIDNHQRGFNFDIVGDRRRYRCRIHIRDGNTAAGITFRRGDLIGRGFGCTVHVVPDLSHTNRSKGVNHAVTIAEVEGVAPPP